MKYYMTKSPKNLGKHIYNLGYRENSTIYLSYWILHFKGKESYGKSVPHSPPCPPK